MRARARRRGCVAALLALALGALLAPTLRRGARSRADFPQHSAGALAHFLADFSHQPRLSAHIAAPWRVEEEDHNRTCWRYSVAYECGALCAGRARVQACEAGGRHRVRLAARRCWPLLCVSSESDSEVAPRAGGGARLDERALEQCSVLAALAGRCDVRAARRAHLRALRAALAAHAPDAAAHDVE